MQTLTRINLMKWLKNGYIGQLGYLIVVLSLHYFRLYAHDTSILVFEAVWMK